MTTLAITEPTIRAAAATLSFEVFESFAEAESLRQEWDEFVLSVEGDIYMSFDWCHTWWEHYGDGRELRIYLFRRGGELVAALPICIQKLWLGPVSLRIARLIGSDSSLTLCNPAVAPSDADEVFVSLLEDLIQNCRCDAVSFPVLAGTYESIDALRSACAARPGAWTPTRDVDSGTHIVLDTPSSFDAYLANLSKSQRGNYRRQMRLLETDRRIIVDVVTDVEQGLREFAAFRALHEAQWNVVGKSGHFGDWPGSAQFNETLVRRMGQLGRLRMVRIIADEQVISYQYCYVFGRTYFWRLPARVTGAEWDKIGLGGISVAKEVEFAIAEGVTQIETGIGHYDYKLQWGGTEFPMRSIMVSANRRSARIRCALFARLSELLHLLYYRIWFLRVLPKLRMRPGPLWRMWIRSRL